MKRKLFKGVLVYAVCACVAFATVPILAEENSATVSKDTGTVVKEEIVPTGWNAIDGTYLETINNKVLDISSLSISTGNKSIEIPNSVSNITIKGDTSKIYSGLSIVVKTRTTPLNLTIEDLKISGSGTGMDVTGNSSTTSLMIKGENSIVSTGANGIAVYTGNTLVIDADSDASTLIIRAGNESAGIGGRFYTGAGEIKKGNGKITIKGGTIDVVGGAYAAAIGSAKGALTKQEEIVISGGHITATGGMNAAGIGSGNEVASEATQISISGGTIIANGKGGGAGIGMGFKCGQTPFDISILGGTITAVGEAGGAGIGGGLESHANKIIIKGGIIEKAEGSGSAAGIGAGGSRGFELIQIGASNVKSDNPTIKNVKGGASGGCAIGTGAYGSGTGNETILLYSGIIDELSASGGAAAIGGGNERGVKEIQIGYTRIGKVYSSGGGTAIGGGRIGQNGEGKVTLLPGSVIYADTDGESVLGGGLDRSLPVILQGEAFLGKNNIDYVQSKDPNINNYAFECYKAIGATRQLMTTGDFTVKSQNDPNIELKPTTDNSGRIYAYLHDLSGKKIGDSGYYFRIKDGDDIYYAQEFERIIEGSLTVLKMEFIKLEVPKPKGEIKEVSGSKIIPYAVSNIDVVSRVEEDTSGVAKDGNDDVNYVNLIIKLNPQTSDVAPFDLSDTNKIKFIVYERSGVKPGTTEPNYVYSSTLTTQMQTSAVINYDLANKQIKVEYPTGLKKYGEFKISVLIPNTLNKEIKKYLTENVESGNADEHKIITAQVEYGITRYFKIDNIRYSEQRSDSKTANVTVPYWYLTKIN